ncbi:uncharacterized protein K452DRAFT_291139 [Aplosporella prunicola CBS 121167]|uniref:Uncharacterized protein n=1 Tax=Aplosporella prunicola CBS 121167 TaxID=1176127 RepID=A0A6A6B546_9PEZI|nr:uncharacterized protein K452DRAFT_291139 [Aplosporella prunicola CBS 121167]KAF2138097.1 hypothetical protein K452DRAFT_291139 [Aplosporella prunicola CBS 121167]
MPSAPILRLLARPLVVLPYAASKMHSLQSAYIPPRDRFPDFVPCSYFCCRRCRAVLPLLPWKPIDSLNTAKSSLQADNWHALLLCQTSTCIQRDPLLAAYLFNQFWSKCSSRPLNVGNSLPLRPFFSINQSKT